MLFDIPNELIPYVRISKKQGLVCSDDMPQELMQLFDETKQAYERNEKDRLCELEDLLVNDKND